MAPEARPLPNHEQHRHDLLAAIRAESAGAGRPVAGDRPGPFSRPWVAPAAAAAAVLAVVAATTTVHALARSGNGSPAGGQGNQAPAAASTATATATAPVTSKPTSLGGGEQRVTTSFDVAAAVTSLTVDDPAGSVTVTAGDVSAVSVTAAIYYAGTAPSITRDLSPAKALALGYSACSKCGVGFSITVPRNASVNVTEDTGAVTLTGIGGNVSVRVGTGSVTATGLTGLTGKFNVGHGRIQAGFTVAPTLVDAAVDTGAVTVQVPSSATYQVTASSAHGPARVTVPRGGQSSHVVNASASAGTVAVTPAG
jgi:hypothetical protein